MELALTPSGRITLRPTTDPQGTETDGQLGRLAKAFGSSQGEGLFLLATERLEGPLPPAFSYWRDFAAGYLTALCHTPEIAGLELEAIPPPTSGELATLILSVPPMQGAEYLSEATLLDAWNDLDAWTRDAIAAGGEGLSGFLKRRAAPLAPGGAGLLSPGRKPPQPGLPLRLPGDLRAERGSGSRVQYQPLSRALRELAGARTTGPGAPAVAGAGGVGKERTGEGTGRIGRPLPAVGLDARARPIASSRTCRCWKRAASWCGCPTGGRNVPAPASA